MHLCGAGEGDGGGGRRRGEVERECACRRPPTYLTVYPPYPAAVAASVASPDSAVPDKQMLDKFLFVKPVFDCCIIMRAGAARACVQPVIILPSERTIREECSVFATDGSLGCSVVDSSLDCLGGGVNAPLQTK